MSPPSIWTYYRSNKRKVLPVTGIIALAVLAISSTGALTESLFADERREIALFDQYAIVAGTQRSIGEGLLQAMREHPAVAQVVPLERRNTRIQGIFGSQGVAINFLLSTDQEAFASRMGWGLVEGRWPEPGTNEVALTENILANRGLRLGDRIGRLADERDFLAGEWRIVGIFPAAAGTGGIADLGYLRQHFLPTSGLPVEFPERPRSVALAVVHGQERELEAFLDSLPREEVNTVHRTRIQREQAEELANVNTIIWILNAVTITVLALALGLLNVIFYMQRANEFGLLSAMGYSKGFLMGRTFLEAAVTVGMGWVAGILLSQGIYSIINGLVFAPKGLAPLAILTPRVLSFTLPVPITVTLFSVAIVLVLLWRLDPVAIIERRD